MAKEYRDTPTGEEMKCPECSDWASADFVDNGVGLQRCGPYHCEKCGWVEQSLFDLFDS